MANIVNLTPHAITLMVGEKSVTIQPSGTVARASTMRAQVGEVKVDGLEIPVNLTRFGEVTGIPEVQSDTVYIVSAIVAQATTRADVVMVDDAVRDSEGRIIGARALAQAR